MKKYGRLKISIASESTVNFPIYDSYNLPFSNVINIVYEKRAISRNIPYRKMLAMVSAQDKSERAMWSLKKIINS